MSLALIYPSWLGLGRIESSSFPRSNGMFQYLTGLPDGPDPQTWRRFLSGAPPDFRHQLHRINRRLQQPFIQWPEPRSRLILDWDGTAVTVCGHQEPAEVGCHPRYRGQRSYNPRLCLEANSSFLWDAELRPGKAGTWEGSGERLASCFTSLPANVRELRVRADAGFGYPPGLDLLAVRPVQYAVVARNAPGAETQSGRLEIPPVQPTGGNRGVGASALRPDQSAPRYRCTPADRANRTGANLVPCGTLLVSGWDY